ncbi:MAG: hypothetical protein IPG75_15110 [Gemmatimonadetes bacterium]|nr:hypothetical protein [Gemmatimonadota bacterium]
MVIWRFTAGGISDGLFNGGGVLVHGQAAGGSGNDGARGVVLDGSGRVVVAGRSVGGGGDAGGDGVAGGCVGGRAVGR